MKIDLQDLLEKSFVISINDSRYAIFCKRFEHYRLVPIPKRYIGFKFKNGIYSEAGLIKTKNNCNCRISHIALIKMAQSFNWPFICIFEDDSLPCIDCASKFQMILNQIPNDIDLLKLGHLGSISTVKQIDESFEKCYSYGSHAYIVFQQYYKKFIETAEKEIHIDAKAMNNSKCKIYTTIDMLFMQDDYLFNDTLHNNSKYLELLKKQNKLSQFLFAENDSSSNNLIERKTDCNE